MDTPQNRGADMTGITKKREWDSMVITEKTLGITVGFRKKAAQSCWDSIGILKQSVLGLHWDYRNKIRDSICITENVLRTTVGLYQNI